LFCLFVFLQQFRELLNKGIDFITPVIIFDKTYRCFRAFFIFNIPFFQMAP